MITLLASSDWHHYGWFWLWPLAWLVVLLVLARFFWRGRRGPWAAAAAPDPRTILAERYARGEIGYEEYRERLGHLEER